MKKILYFSLLLAAIIIFSNLGLLQTKKVFAIGYSFERTLTIDHTKVPATQSAFTILVCANSSAPCNTSISGLNQSGAGAHVTDPSGNDIVFSTTPGCNSGLLNWEMEKYVASTGEMEAWVNIPSLSSTVDTPIYMCYGNSSISSFQGGSTGSAWDSSYKGVWHLKESTGATRKDSTTSGNDLLDPSAAVTGTSAGQIDGAASFTEVASSLLNFTNPIVFSSATPWTLDFWMNCSSYSLGTQKVVFGTSGNSIIAINGPYAYLTDDAAESSYTTPGTENTGTWYHWVYAYPGAGAVTYLYYNGVGSSVGYPNTFQNSFTMDGLAKGDLACSLDEVTISQSLRTPQWITTEYNNQSSPATFETFGGEGAVDTIPPTVSITAPTDGATVLGTISVTATASDNIGVVGVQLKLDNVNLGAEMTTAPYSYSWDTTPTSNGSHVLVAVARDGDGNTTSSTPVTVTINNPVADPTFSPTAGTYNNTQSVTISSTTPGASIYFTTDNSTPSSSSTLYSGPISVSAPETIQAIGEKSGNYANSNVTSATYAFTVATPVASPAAGTYSATQLVSLTSATSGATIHYTTDGSTPDCSSTTYSSALTVSGASTTIKAIACESSYTNSGILSANYDTTGGAMVYVRDSAPGSVSISGMTPGNPATISTLTPDGFNVGDIVGVWGICSGTTGVVPSPVNGIRKVKTVIDSTHFTITDLNNNNINEPNASVNCGTPVGEPDSAKWTSKLTPYTLGAGPLAWLDGNNGTLMRKLSLGTQNGLVSLVVSTNLATVTTSYANGLSTGDKISVWGSGNTALNTGNGTGAGAPYTVTVVDSTHFTFAAPGVPDGTYSNFNNSCGPAPTPNDTIGGTQDCLRVSQLAYTGNPMWDSIISSSKSDFTNGVGNNSYKMLGDGGSTILSKDSSYAGYYWWGEAAIRFLVDQSNTRMLSVIMYTLNNPEKVIGVNWHCDEDYTDCGANDTGYAGEFMDGISWHYMVGGSYLSAAHKQTFLDKIYNDIDDPSQLIASKADANMSNDSHNRVLTTGVVQGGSSTTITLASSDSKPDGYYVNNVVQLLPVGSGGLQYGTYTSGITATGSVGQTCVLTGFNGGGTGALATVALTGTNTIASGTPLYVILPATTGIYSSDPTSATASSGTATCSGTATVATTAGTSQSGGIHALITAYNSSTKVATVASWKYDSTAVAPSPAAGDGYKIYATMALSSVTTAAMGVTATGYNTTWNTPGASDQVHVGDMVEGGNDWILANGAGDPGFSASYVTAVNSDTSLTVTNYFPTHFGGATTTPSISWSLVAWKPGDVGLIWWLKHWLAFQGAKPVLYPTSGGETANGPNPNEGGNNSVLTQAGMTALGVVTAADEPRSVPFLAMGESYGFDYLIRHYMDYSAGILHSGSIYSSGVQKNLGLFASVIQNSFTPFPNMDLAGPWIIGSPLEVMFNALPDRRTQAGIQTVYAPYITEDSEGWMSNGSLVAQYNILNPVFHFDPNNTVTKYFNYFLRNVANLNFAASLGPAGNYLDKLGLLYIDPKLQQLNYDVQPHQYAFLKSSSSVCATLTGWACPANFAGQAVISRTGWDTRSDSLLMYESRPFVGDHDIPHQGLLQFWKVGGLLGVDSVPGVLSFNGWDMTTNGDMLRFGGTSQYSVKGAPFAGSSAGVAPIIRWASGNHGSWDSQYGDQDSKYAYWTSDLSGVYLNPTVYAQRSIAHLKDQTINGGTGEEVIVQYDSADLTGHPNSLDFHIHYEQNGQTLQEQNADAYYYDEGSTTCPGTGGCANLNANRTIQSMESGATADLDPARQYGIITKIFSPGTITVRDDTTDITVSAVSNGNPIVFTATSHGLVTGDPVTILGATGDWAALNTKGGLVSIITVIDSNHFSIPGNSSAYSGSFNGTVTTSYSAWTNLRAGIASVSKGNPIIVTTAGAHLIASGQILGIFGATGDWAALNNDSGHLVATVIDPTHFSIPGDSTGFSGSFDGTILTANIPYFSGGPSGSGFGYSNRVSICGGSTCGASVTKFDSIVVHKVAQNMTDTTLIATPLNPDSNWTGVQTKDKVVLFARGGVTHNTMGGFTTTHSGTAQYLFGGLTAGTYAVTIGGTPVTGSPFTVTNGDNSIAFESTAGVVSVNGSADMSKSITSFNFTSPSVTGIVTENTQTVALTVPFGTNVTALVPTISINGSSISPNSGVAQNFTNPVTYTVTAADSSTQQYVVTVTVSSATSHTLSGTIKYYDNTQVLPNVTVTLEDGSGNPITSTTTDSNGTYSLTNVADGGNYIVVASKADATTTGESAADEIKIARQIVGLELFDTIYKNIAGDVNLDGILNSADEIKIARHLVGLDALLPSGAWKFYSSSVTPTTGNYLTTGISRTYTNLTSDASSQNFVGIKMGDTDRSW